MQYDGPIEMILGLTEDWKVISGEGKENGVSTFKVKYIGKVRCPICNKPCSIKDHRIVTWNAGDMFGFPGYIEGKVPRANCPKDGVHMIHVDFASETAAVTKKLERKVTSLAMHSTYTVVAETYHLHLHTVMNLANSMARKMLSELDLSDLKYFLFDEKAYKSGHKYITFFVDPVSGSTIFATSGRGNGTLEDFFRFLLEHNGDPFKIKAICADMSPAFAKGIEFWFPNSVLVIDPYHLQDLVARTIDLRRRAIGLKSKLGAGARNLLRTNHSNLDLDKHERLIQLLTKYDELGELYIVKELLKDLYSHMSPNDAVLLLDYIIEKCGSSEFKSIHNIGFFLV